MNPFECELIACRPQVQKYAYKLLGSHDRAMDLTQDTLVQALRNQDKYQMGTNMVGWLRVICRNLFLSEVRKRRLDMVSDFPMDAVTSTADHLGGTRQSTPGGGRWVCGHHQPDAFTRMEVQDVLAATVSLPPKMREALLLVAIGDASYAQAAERLHTNVGTVKSRVSRARAALHT